MSLLRGETEILRNLTFLLILLLCGLTLFSVVLEYRASAAFSVCEQPGAICVGVKPPMCEIPDCEVLRPLLRRSRSVNEGCGHEGYRRDPDPSTQRKHRGWVCQGGVWQKIRRAQVLRSAPRVPCRLTAEICQPQTPPERVNRSSVPMPTGDKHARPTTERR